MPRPRLPQGKAETSGAAAHDPGRFKDRKGPKRTRKLGEPYANMTDAECVHWAEFQQELPWLTSADRQLVRMACQYGARADKEPLGISATQAFVSILSKLGATPTDVTKVRHGDDEESEDPTDKFFQ